MKRFFALALIAAVACTVTCEEDIEQLCESELSVKCVREFFSKHADCKVVDSPNEHPSYDVNLPIYMPKMNMTVITTTTRPSQLEGDLEAFYIDRETNNLIFSMNYKGLFCDAPDTILAFHQNGKEPKVVQEYINATYPTVLTAVIPLTGSDGVDVDALKAARVSAYFEHSNAVIHAGPKFSASEDPVIAESFDSFVENFPLALQEIFRTKAAFYFLIYLQNYVCDFEVEPNLQNEFDTVVVDNILLLESGEEADDIIEPCDQSEDMMECVKKFFHDRGECEEVGTPGDGPVFRPLLNTYAPFLNLTAVTTFSMLSGLDGKIENFYINKQTQNLVLSACFEGIEMNAPSVPLVIDQRGQAPKVVTDSNKDTYPVTLTAVIPLNTGLTPDAVKEAFVTAHFNDEVTFEIGNNYQSEDETDPQVQDIMDKVDEHPILVAQELFVTEASSLFRAFLQKYICDFSLNIY